MNTKNAGIAVSIFFLLVFSSVAFWLFRKPLVPSEEGRPRISRAEIENILALSKATFGYPKILDEEVRADDARITDQDEFEIFVTLLKVDSRDGTQESLVANAKSRLPAYACDIRQLRFLLYKGITVLLTFKSRDQVNLFQYQITPKMCGE